MEMHKELWYRSELDGSEKWVHAPDMLHLALPTRLNEPYQLSGYSAEETNTLTLALN